MRGILTLGLGLLLAGSASAYGVGGFRGGMGGFRGGIVVGRGNFSPVFPAGFRRAPIGFGAFRHRGFAFRRAGFRPYSYAGYPGWYGGWWPDYSYPAYEPASYAPNYGYAPAAPQVIVIAPMAQPLVEAREPRPEMREYPAEPEGGASPAPPGQIYFLVPFKDRTVQAAVAYWVEAGTLHYITIAGVYRTAPLSDIDREAAEKLNKGRPIQLRLPAPKR